MCGRRRRPHNLWFRPAVFLWTHVRPARVPQGWFQLYAAFIFIWSFREVCNKLVESLDDHTVPYQERCSGCCDRNSTFSLLSCFLHRDKGLLLYIFKELGEDAQIKPMVRYVNTYRGVLGRVTLKSAVSQFCVQIFDCHPRCATHLPTFLWLLWRRSQLLSFKGEHLKLSQKMSQEDSKVVKR